MTKQVEISQETLKDGVETIRQLPSRRMDGKRLRMLARGKTLQIIDFQVGDVLALNGKKYLVTFMVGEDPKAIVLASLKRK